MKRIIILSIGIATLCFSACKKDNDNNKSTPVNNTWLVTPDDEVGTQVYKMKTIVLRTNIKQVLEATSEDNPGGGINGTKSSITLSFPTVGPPPSGTYKVTAYEKLTSTDQVSIAVITSGTMSNSGPNVYWYSPEGGNQTISYKFENGKASAVFKDIVINQNGSSGPTTGKVSANISQ